METKRVTENFYERNTPDCDPDTIKVTLDSIETLFEECDKKLTEAELSPSNYESQELQIGVMRNNLLTLQLYVADAHNEVYNELDKTLCDDFQNGATHTLSNIVLSEIETENTFMMEEHLQFNEMSGTYYLKEVKKSVTMADFLGLAAVEPGEGAPTLENMETVGIFATLFRMDYQSFQESGVDVDQIMEVYLYSGEYAHKKNEPVKEFVSGLLDITIVKPFIECIVGKDLITGEKLTDFEMAMKFVDVAIGVLTFGQGTLAIDAAGLVGKEAFSAMMKTWAIDVAADAAAYTAGYVCDELGLPQEAVVLASLITGCTVSVTASKKYLFVDSAGNEVMECTPEELEALLKNGGSGNIEGGAPTKILSLSEAEEMAFDAIHGPSNADAVVLGKYGDGGPSAYTTVAKDMDAQFFQLDNWDELVDIYSEDEIWKINERFLDIQTSSGREIYLSHNPAEYIMRSDFYSKELNYLVENGYTFVKEGDIWHAIR